jgi:hypothetical protein
MNESNVKNDHENNDVELSANNENNAPTDNITISKTRAKNLLLLVISFIVILLVVFVVVKSDKQTTLITKPKSVQIDQASLTPPVIPSVESESRHVELNEQVVEETLPENEIITETAEVTFVDTVEEEAIEEPQISLDESDLWLSAKLNNFIPTKSIVNLVVTEGLIRRMVIFTDSMTRGEVIYKYSPLQSPDAKFTLKDMSNNKVQTWAWDESTTARFTPYVQLVQALSTEDFIAIYSEMKPLINQVYSELGYPDTDFTDTLIDAIDHIVDFNMPDQSLALTRTSVMYKYKDEYVESLQDIDKLLIRIGADNIEQLTPQLQSIRKMLVEIDK